MNIIARGAQYKIIDIGNGRIRKILLSPVESREVVASWYAEGDAAAEELTVDYQGPALESTRIVDDLLKNHPDLAPSLGNPVFESEGGYTQDKVQTLRWALQHSGEAAARRLIDSYIDITLRHWEYGLGERVFNFSVNNGLDAHGQVILFDFGEITTDPENMARRITKKRWLRAFSYLHDLPVTLQEYYREQMRRRLTIPALEERWGRALRGVKDDSGQ